MKETNYSFVDVRQCDMCGADPSHFKTLGKRLDRAQGRAPWKLQGTTTPIKKCNCCGLIFADPQPIPENIQDHYGLPPEQYWRSEDVFEYRNEFFPELAVLKQLMKIEPGKRALDIGAGLGKCMITLTNAGFDTYGLEPSEPFFKKAIEKMKIPTERLKLGMIENADYPLESFDFITFGAVLEHLYSPAASIEKAMKWLKPGGLIHVEVPSSDWLISRMMNRYYRWRGSDFVSNISPRHAPYHLYEFSPRSFEFHGMKNGYEITRCDHFVCSTYLPKAIDVFVRPYMSLTKSGMQMVIWLKKK